MSSEDIPSAIDAGFNVNGGLSGEDKIIIKVLGVGGGGNNAVSHMYKQGIKNVSFAVLNTDRKALNHSPVPTKVQIGNGLGAGNKPDVAREAAENAADKIAELFRDDTQMVFITAGMGGGTGTGAAPVVARIAQECGMLTIGIVTIPFLFEGEKKIMKALEGADEMSKHVDAMLIINNQRLTDIYPELNLINAFGKADDTLTTAARSISELITCDGAHIHLDFNDVDTTLRNGGAAIISTGYGEGENRVTKAIDDALNSPLLKNRDILSSKKLLFNLYFNPDADFTMAETDELTSFISGIDKEVDVIWGMAYEPSLGDKVKITILAAGFAVTVDDNASRAKGSGGRMVSFGKEKEAKEAIDSSRIVEEYGKAVIGRMAVEKARARYIVLQPSQMDDDRFIDAFEKSPTFNREKKNADEIKRMGTNASASATASASQHPQSSAGDNPSVIKF